MIIFEKNIYFVITSPFEIKLKSKNSNIPAKNQLVVDYTEHLRPKSATDIRRVFVNNSLDQMQYSSRHESQSSHVIPRQKPNYRHMKRLFKEQISKH